MGLRFPNPAKLPCIKHNLISSVLGFSFIDLLIILLSSYAGKDNVYTQAPLNAISNQLLSVLLIYNIQAQTKNDI